MYYKNDPKLRASGYEFEYDKDQINEVKKCMSDFVYFSKNYIKVVDQDTQRLVPLDFYPYQQEMAGVYQRDRRIIVLAPRQSGKSIFTIAYLLWVGLFKDYQNIVLVANKEKTAKKTLRKLKEMYRELPFFLKQGITEWNKMAISFENGSNIYAESTSSSGNRGDTASIVFIDEAAIIEASLWEDFYTSVYPTIASLKNAQIIVTSTPKGFNHFFGMWNMAVNKQSEYTPIRVKWDDVPGRDEAYKTKTINELGGGAKGLRKWRQEYECFFVGSGGSLIEGEILEKLIPKQILETLMDESFNIYEKPRENAAYCLIADVAEGVGEDDSTAQVFRLNFKDGHEQVAVYRNNLIKTNEFDLVIDGIAKIYNDALIIVEANTYGREILNRLVYDDDAENVFFANEEKDYGIKMTRSSKSLGNSYLKSNIEKFKIKIHDFDTINQLSKYIKVKDTYKADKGQHDDLVTPLVLFSYFLSKRDWIENWIDVDANDMQNKIQQQIESELLPIGFICNGSENFNLTSIVNNDDDSVFDD